MDERKLTLKLETVSGMVNMFYAFVDGERVIAADGTSQPQGTATVKGQARIKVRVWGIARGQYKLTIDLPGTAEDQQIICTLDRGYHELEMEI